MISNETYQKAADLLGVDIATVKAVAHVESNGSGFVNGHPTILFEGHVFHGLTAGVHDRLFPTISYPKWTKAHYSKANEGEFLRLQMALILNSNAALQSTSWGMFQIMGFNFKACGFETVQDFVDAMYKSEDDQLMAFVNFIRSQRLLDHLQSHDWARFARSYNGPGYAVNQYDKKMADAYRRFSAESQEKK